MTTPTKAAVRKDDWERFRLDGGALVIYPPRKGGEMAGMIPIWVSEERPPTGVAVHPARGPIKPKPEKAHAD